MDRHIHHQVTPPRHQHQVRCRRHNMKVTRRHHRRLRILTPLRHSQDIKDTSLKDTLLHHRHRHPSLTRSTTVTITITKIRAVVPHSSEGGMTDSLSLSSLRILDLINHSLNFIMISE